MNWAYISTYSYVYICSYMLNKNTLGVKKCEANQKQHCKQAFVTKSFRPRVLSMANFRKSGQVTKPIILVKICYNLLYVIQGLKNIFDEVTCWPQLISNFWSHMPVCNAASDWPRTFLYPRCFCLAYHYFLSKSIWKTTKTI